jgi:hypothetical protein
MRVCVAYQLPLLQFVVAVAWHGPDDTDGAHLAFLMLRGQGV